MSKNNIMFASLHSSVDQLRFHLKISGAWLAGLLIALIILGVAALLPSVLDSNRRTHAATIDDLAQLTGDKP